MQYDLIRLVLVSREQTSLFERRDHTGEPLSRERWLRHIFAAEITFWHRATEFHYVPHPDLSGAFIVGQIGRQSRIIENEPPESGFRETVREPWHAANVIIDPTHHLDGQKIAFETKAHVGQALSIIKSLSNTINERPDEPYVIEANAIVNPETFWEFERENRGDITSITFDLIAPNMFGIRDDMAREMAGFRDNEKARKVSISLQNEDGLKLDDDRVRQSVQYAVDGGGEIKAKTKKRKRFSSSTNGKRIPVDVPKEVEFQSLSATIALSVSRLFGGDHD